jgi:hypothetical protein
MESQPFGRAAFPQGLENPRRVFHSSTASTTAKFILLEFGLDSL